MSNVSSFILLHLVNHAWLCQFVAPGPWLPSQGMCWMAHPLSRGTSWSTRMACHAYGPWPMAQDTLEPKIRRTHRWHPMFKKSASHLRFSLPLVIHILYKLYVIPMVSLRVLLPEQCHHPAWPAIQAAQKCAEWIFRGFVSSPTRVQPSYAQAGFPSLTWEDGHVATQVMCNHCLPDYRQRGFVSLPNFYQALLCDCKRTQQPEERISQNPKGNSLTSNASNVWRWTDRQKKVALACVAKPLRHACTFFLVMLSVKSDCLKLGSKAYVSHGQYSLYGWWSSHP